MKKNFLVNFLMSVGMQSSSIGLFNSDRSGFWSQNPLTNPNMRSKLELSWLITDRKKFHFKPISHLFLLTLPISKTWSKWLYIFFWTESSCCWSGRTISLANNYWLKTRTKIRTIRIKQAYCTPNALTVSLGCAVNYVDQNYIKLYNKNY